MENMHVAAQRNDFKGLISRWSSTHEQKRALELLDFVGLTSLKDLQAGNLSFGQKKLLEFAFILIADPQVILLDEPAGASIQRWSTTLPTAYAPSTSAA
jgi:neutral amino acid transport system ATP-binding protein